MKNRKKSAKYRYQLRQKRRLEKYGSFLHSECPVCGEDTFFYDKYDSIVCFRCDVWFSKACDDPNCPFCAGRPEFPSKAIWAESENNPQPVSGKEQRLFRCGRKYNGTMRHKNKKIFIQKQNDQSEMQW